MKGIKSGFSVGVIEYEEKIEIKKIVIISGGALSAAVAGLSMTAKQKRGSSVYDNEPEQKNLMEGNKVIFVKNDNDKKMLMA